MRKIFVLIGATIFLAGCGSMSLVGGTKTLTEPEVRLLFVGNTVESYNRNTGFNSFTYYHPDGQAVQQRLWSRRLGAWAIEDDGKICLAFGKSTMRCRHIVKEGGRYYKVVPDEAGNRQKIISYRYFAHGNRLDSERQK
jgi:hypothetical protein